MTEPYALECVGVLCGCGFTALAMSRRSGLDSLKTHQARTDAACGYRGFVALASGMDFSGVREELEVARALLAV